MNRRLIISALAFMTMAIASRLASAEDGKSYPGSACLPYSSANQDIMERFAQYIENTSSANSLLVTCPIIKDNVADTVGLNYIRITYTKQDSAGFYCAVYAKSSSGTSTYSSSEWDFDGAGTKNMVLDDIAGFSSGTYSLYCILPPGAQIHSYRIDET